MKAHWCCSGRCRCVSRLSPAARCPLCVSGKVLSQHTAAMKGSRVGARSRYAPWEPNRAQGAAESAAGYGVRYLCYIAVLYISLVEKAVFSVACRHVMLCQRRAQRQASLHTRCRKVCARERDSRRNASQRGVVEMPAACRLARRGVGGALRRYSKPAAAARRVVAGAPIR